MASFWKPEACGQTVLPDRSVFIGQKLVENGKIQKFKCDILSNFQTMWTDSNHQYLISTVEIRYWWSTKVNQKAFSTRKLYYILSLFFSSKDKRNRLQITNTIENSLEDDLPMLLSL